MINTRVELRTMRIADLVPAGYNPREIDGEALAGLAASIERWGVVEPIIVNDRTGNVVGGHQRLKVLLSAIGTEGAETDVVVVNIDEDDERALNITLNNPEIAGVFTAGVLPLIEQIKEALGPLASALRLDVLGEKTAALLRETERTALRKESALSADRGVIGRTFIINPFSVLDTCAGAWAERREMWNAIGQFNVDPSRANVVTFGSANAKAKSTRTIMAQKAHPTSMFDPVLAELLVRWYCPPGGRVLDPFAGGPCRGAVSAILGRRYTGIDLRADQIGVNESEWTRISASMHLGGAEPTVSEGLTPIQVHGGVTVKRDDLFATAGVRGGKVRTCAVLARDATLGLITAGSRHSPQVAIVARVGAALGLPVRVHVPDGPATPETDIAAAAGAAIVRHPAGRNSVIVARARADAQESGWTEIPFGMECVEAVRQTAGQTENIPPDTQRIVVPVGSGMSLAGILTGLMERGLDVPVLGVVVGAAPEKRLDKYAPPGWRDRVEMVETGLGYDEPVEAALGELRLDPHYEAKCARFLQPGDLFWVVGIRPSADSSAIVRPNWIVGDGLDCRESAAGEYDFLLSCPPYGDLEQYNPDDPRDISNMDHAQFLETHGEIVARAAGMLRENRFAAWVVGEIRDKNGLCRRFPEHTVDAFERAGLRLYNDAILRNSGASAAIRAAGIFGTYRKLVRTHQEVLVFVKGDPKAAAQACGPVDVTMPTPEDEQEAEE